MITNFHKCEEIFSTGHKVLLLHLENLTMRIFLSSGRKENHAKLVIYSPALILESLSIILLISMQGCSKQVGTSPAMGVSTVYSSV